MVHLTRKFINFSNIKLYKKMIMIIIKKFKNKLTKVKFYIFKNYKI